MSRLAGKVALVTGGGSGLGRAVAQRFAAEGAKVVVADLDGARAETVAKGIGSNAAAIVCDHTLSEHNKRAVAFAVEQFGALDIVHNNAGGPFTGVFEDADDDTMERVLRTNLFGVMQMSRAALPHLRASGKKNPAGASLLFTSSLQGLKAKPNFSLYTVAKHGIVGLAGRSRGRVQKRRQVAAQLAEEPCERGPPRAGLVLVEQRVVGAADG